jgi:Protein of unknown function (DUF2971)
MQGQASHVFTWQAMIARRLSQPLNFTMTNSISQLADDLYRPMPWGHLYHYTGYEALLSIGKSKELWASEMHYFNDASELLHAGKILISALENVSNKGEYPKEIIDQLKVWLPERLKNGHQLFVLCFSLKGNLLSQWRGYTPHGRGVSLGFNPSALAELALAQNFSIGECIYAPDRQLAIAEHAVTLLLQGVLAAGSSDTSKCHPSQSYFPAFVEIESDLLRIAALIKHPAFLEESEWRAVSSVQGNYMKQPIKFRSGRNTLIPYLPFKIGTGENAAIMLEKVFLGPTSENNLAMSALSKFLAINGFKTMDGIESSQLPFRET